MNGPTTPTTREQSGFDRALGEYLHARDTLNALPVEPRDHSNLPCRYGTDQRAILPFNPMATGVAYRHD